MGGTENDKPIKNSEDFPRFSRRRFSARYRGIQNYTSEPEDKPEDRIPVYLIPDEGESVRPNKK